MGANKSKCDKTLQCNTDEAGSIPSTPILTSKVFKESIDIDHLDPRSPSRHIARTPIELLSATAEALESLHLESNSADIKDTPLKRHILLGIDPRSPTLEIQRTPIVVSASPDKKLPDKIKNKNLDKVRRNALSTPRIKTIPPKLLESTPVTPKIRSDTYKRKSLVLLETNIDYTETDLDSVLKEKFLDQNSDFCDENVDPRSPTTDFLRTPLQIPKSKQTNVETNHQNSSNTPDQISPTIDSTQTQKLDDIETTTCNEECSEECLTKNEHLDLSQEQTVENDVLEIIEDLLVLVFQNKHTEVPELKQEITDNNLNVNQFIINNADHNSVLDNPEIIENVVVPSDAQSDMVYSNIPLENKEKNESVQINQNPCLQAPPTKPKRKIPSPIPKEKVYLPKTAPSSPPQVINVTPKKSHSLPVTPPLINLTADVKELDKKLTDLIYEDEDLVVCPRIVKLKDQNRTPLAECNGKDERKSSQKLKVSGKPRKNISAESKIPVFKTKKIKTQCENTPPRDMKAFRTKKAHWDPKDNTLVI